MTTRSPGAPARWTTVDAFLNGRGIALRRTLVARYGVEDGCEAYAEASVYAVEHWDRLSTMDNPAGYLFRVSQTAARRHRRWGRRPRVPLPTPLSSEPALPEPRLPEALGRLPERQRSAVLLVHAHGYSYDETARMLNVPVTTVRNDLHRGLKALRSTLGVES